MKKAVAAGLIGLTALSATVVVPNIAEAQDATQEAPTETDRSADREARRAERIALLTDVLGVGEDVLQAARDTGQSLADIAVEQGVPVENVVNAIVDSKTTHIQEHVDAGDITQDQANERIAGLSERVTERVNATPGERGDGERGHRGHRGHHGLRGADAAAEEAPAA